MWTGGDFSVCEVAPPGERSVGAGHGEAARRGVEVSVEGPRRLFAHEHRAGIPPRLFGLRRTACAYGKGCIEGG